MIGPSVFGTMEFGLPEGGLCNGGRGFRLRPWQYVEGQNLELMGDSLVKRRGTKQVGTVTAGMAGRVDFINRWYYSTSAGSLASSAGKIWYKTTADWIDVGVTWSSSAFTVGCEFADQLFCVNGTSTSKKFTKAAAPSPTTWAHGAAGQPQWVAGPLYNRIFYNDSSAKEFAWYTNDGDPDTTDATNTLRLPDDRMGQEMRFGALCAGNMIGAFGSDYCVNLTGASPLSFRTEKMPRGCAIVSWRTIVDMGGFFVFLTTRGLALWDGDGPVLLLDPKGRVDWSDMDFSTPELTWACRYHDKYLLFVRSKGMATSNVMTGSNTLWRNFAASNILSSARMSYLTAVGPAVAASTSHWMSWDKATKRFEGVHTGAWLSGVWQEYRNGDQQGLMLGAAAATGVIALADQPDTYTDCLGAVSGGVAAATAYDGVYRSGAVGDDPMEEHSVMSLALSMGGRTAGPGVSVRFYFEGDDTSEGASETFSMDSEGAVDVHQGGVAGQKRTMKNGVWRRWVPPTKERTSGFAPQFEIVESSKGPWRLDGFKVEAQRTSMRGGR